MLFVVTVVGSAFVVGIGHCSLIADVVIYVTLLWRCCCCFLCVFVVVVVVLVFRLCVPKSTFVFGFVCKNAHTGIH